MSHSNDVVIWTIKWIVPLDITWGWDLPVRAAKEHNTKGFEFQWQTADIIELHVSVKFKMADLLCQTAQHVTARMKTASVCLGNANQFVCGKCPYDSTFESGIPKAVTSTSDITSNSLLCSPFLKNAHCNILLLCFRASQYKSNITPTWCNTVQVLFLQSHSTCFRRQAPIIRSIKKNWHGGPWYRCYSCR